VAGATTVAELPETGAAAPQVAAAVAAAAAAAAERGKGEATGGGEAFAGGCGLAAIRLGATACDGADEDEGNKVAGPRVLGPGIARCGEDGARSGTAAVAACDRRKRAWSER